MRSTVCCRWYDRESMPHLILFVYGIVIIIIKLNVKRRGPVPHVRMSVRVCDVMCYISPSRSIDCGRTAKCANDIGKKNICTQLNGWAKVKMIFIPSLFTKVYIYSRDQQLIPNWLYTLTQYATEQFYCLIGKLMRIMLNDSHDVDNLKVFRRSH